MQACLGRDYHMWTKSMESAITGRCLLMKPHGDTETDVCVSALSDGTTLRMLILTGGEAWRQSTWGPRTYWSTGMTLSPGAFYHKPNTAEPQRKFQGQTDVESVSLCLWHPCLLSSGMAAAAATWGKKTRREKCSEPANVQKSYKVFTCSIRREGLHTKGYNNAKMKPLPGWHGLCISNDLENTPHEI